jgi:hypothetical protein
MKAVETVQAQMQEVASSHQAACPAFFQDVEALCSTAASYLAQLQKNVRGRNAGVIWTRMTSLLSVD